LSARASAPRRRLPRRRLAGAVDQQQEHAGLGGGGALQAGPGRRRSSLLGASSMRRRRGGALPALSARHTRAVTTRYQISSGEVRGVLRGLGSGLPTAEPRHAHQIQIINQIRYKLHTASNHTQKAPSNRLSRFSLARTIGSNAPARATRACPGRRRLPGAPALSPVRHWGALARRLPWAAGGPLGRPGVGTAATGASSPEARDPGRTTTNLPPSC
jgi:hypothetical protein